MTIQIVFLHTLVMLHIYTRADIVYTDTRSQMRYCLSASCLVSIIDTKQEAPNQLAILCNHSISPRDELTPCIYIYSVATYSQAVHFKMPLRTTPSAKCHNIKQ